MLSPGFPPDRLIARCLAVRGERGQTERDKRCGWSTVQQDNEGTSTPMPTATPAGASRFAGLTPLLSPRSVAILGASNDPVRIGGRPLAYMLAQKFAGAIYPVNPNRAEVQGVKAYASVADLPETPDVAIIAVPAELAVQAVEDLAKRGTKGALMFTAGFAEVDAAGEAEQDRMVAIARAHGMRILGPNCLGVFDARTNYYATFSSSFDSGWPVPGRIGIASQSGAYGTHLYTLARNRGIGASLCIMTGNEADVTVGECIGWLAENPEVDVIAVYAEGIREAPGLIAAFAAARAAKKPIVMQKVGRSELGTKAAKSHTASIAGDDAVTEAVMAEFGVVRARQLRRNAGHRTHRDAAHLPGGQHAGGDHRIRRRRGVDQRRGGKRRPGDAGDAAGRAGAAEGAGFVLRAAQSCGRDRAGGQRHQAAGHLHRIAGARRRLQLGAGLLHHGRIVRSLAGDARAARRWCGRNIPIGSTCCR